MQGPAELVQLGFQLLAAGRVPDAAAAFERAIAIDPNLGIAHYGLSWTMLVQGDFERGWVEHEWRAQCRDLPGNVRAFNRPRWDGSSLDGKTILLYQEQGLGDAIQYTRYAPLVAERGGRVILGVPDYLGRLLITVPGVSAIAANPNQLPTFDTHISLHSLPLMFNTRLETIPATVPYVFPNPEAVQRWSRVFDRSKPAVHVGVCWAGSPKHQNDKLRSIDAAQLAHLAGIPNVRLYSLQKDLTIEQSRRLPNNLSLIDLGADLKDFVETAAAMMNLDLVISVDTSMAHLAGALARPVWTLLPFHADWRWLLHRADSPWYPTMRIIRQSRPNDWLSVLAQVAAEIRTMAAQS